MMMIYHFNRGGSKLIQYWKDADFSSLAEPPSRRKGIANLVGAFDTETSTVVIDGTKYAFMYVWQFAVEDIAVYGRTWDDLREFLLNLRADLKLNSEYKLVVYVHNLKYDFQFFKNELNLEGDFIARDSRTIIKATVNDCFEVRDSGCYTEKPLEQMGLEIGYHKLDGIFFDYNKIRHHLTPLTKDELEYCEHDVLILTKYYRRESKKYRSVKDIPITATRRVKRLIINEMRKCNPKYISVIAAKQLYTSKSKEDKAMLDLLRKSFFGGYTYSNVFYRGKVIKDVTGIDISSSYPAQALLHQFPMEKFRPLKTPETVEELLNSPIYHGKALLITFYADSIKSKYPGIGFISTYLKNYWKKEPPKENTVAGAKNAEASKLIDSGGAVEMTLTDVDFRLMLKFYNVEPKIIAVFGAKYSALPPYIIDTIINLYQKKQELKKRNAAIEKNRRLTFAEEAEYNLVKSMLNRIYGIFVQDPIRINYEFNKKEGKVKANGENRKDKFEGVLYQWGVWIVAWARYELLNLFTAIGIEKGKYKDNIIHCDTDSIYCTGDCSSVVTRYNNYISKQVKAFCQNKQLPESMLAGLGELTEEHYKSFKTVGLKQYAYINNKDRFDYHCAGLTRPDYIYDDDDNLIYNRGMDYFDLFDTNEEKIDEFSNHMYIPAEHAKVHKHIYVDNVENKEIIVTDYLDNTTTVSVSSYIILEFDKYAPAETKVQSKVDDERLSFVTSRLV